MSAVTDELKATGSQKDKMMVVILSVEGGEVLEVFELKKFTGNTITVGNAEKYNPNDNADVRLVATENISHFLAIHNPTCRYVKVGGVWKRVCW